MKSDLARLVPKDFPPLLREIPHPPKQLYLRGTVPPTDWKWLAVVGSRALSSYGKQACEYLIEGLRGYPIAIVSGLAYGADACAHKSALNAGLPTIAVPGSGLDYSVLYPKAHVSLAKDIINAGGAHLSEFEPHEEARDFMFPTRNRIVVGLCSAVLIIEAKEKSGSLITAKLTTDYNRDLLVVPGTIFSATSKGTHQFLKLGAQAVTEPNDILKALGIEPRTVGNIDIRDDVSDEERAVLQIIATPCTRDELLSQLDVSAQDANVLLSMMEIKGLIVEELGMIRIA